MNEDRRLSKRHPLIAEIGFTGDGINQHGRISDLSQGGLFIDTLNTLDEGKPISFSFLLPGDASRQPITGEGIVAWQQPMLGMGIRFTRLAGQSLERLLGFLKTMQA